MLHHGSNRGLGAALRTGVAACRGGWIAALDADLTFHPSHLGALLRAGESAGADCVSGSPWLMDGSAMVPAARRVPSRLANGLYRLLFDRRLSAYTPVFRLYRADALKALRWSSDGFAAPAEILVRLLRSGASVIEVPVPLLARRTGRSKLRVVRETAAHLALIARLLAGR